MENIEEYGYEESIGSSFCYVIGKMSKTKVG